MTFKQTEKEFDEYFLEQMGKDDGYTEERRIVKSFLKRSFIKYLQSQIDFIDDKVREEIKLETVEMCDVYLGKLYAYRDMKEHLQAQIKELEG